MTSLQKQVSDVCKLADSVVKNPSRAIDDVAKSLEVSPSIVAFAAGAVFVPDPWAITGIITAIWKVFKDTKRQRQEKERMLREVISKQQAVIRKLQMEDASNKIEIDNLKHMLEMLNKVEGVIKAA
jgi:hypothetical protein